MLRIISALTFLFGLAIASSTTSAQTPDSPALADDAPDRHIVVPGDTLWSIAGKFLKDPWRWPDLWKLNKDQVKNPHRIYPGDIIVLDRTGGTLKLAKPLKLEPKVYISQERQAIPSIPPNVIAPFLSQPLVIEADALTSAPQVVGTRDGRVLAGRGDEIFAHGITDTVQRQWSIYRPGKPLKDPDSQQVLGHEAIFLGTATLEAGGEMALFKITSSTQEISKGDRMIPTERPPLVAFAPRKPDTAIGARIMSVYGGVTGGQFNIVTLNKGRQDGLEIGHVLAISRSGRTEKVENKEGKKEVVTYPDQRYGLLFVFRTFDRVAYALVMQATQPLAIGDAVFVP